MDNDCLAVSWSSHYCRDFSILHFNKLWKWLKWLRVICFSAFKIIFISMTLRAWNEERWEKKQILKQYNSIPITYPGQRTTIFRWKCSCWRVKRCFARNPSTGELQVRDAQKVVGKYFGKYARSCTRSRWLRAIWGRRETIDCNTC